MKKKDIIVLIICLVVILGSGYFLFRTLKPKTNTVNTQSEEKKVEFTGNYDEKALEEIKKYNDYGEAKLDNIGRVNPFGPLN